MQKCLLTLTAVLFTLGGAYGQEFTKAFSSASGKKKVEIMAENISLTIEGYNGNEVVIETEDDYEGPPERAEGLRPLYNGATDNTNMGLQVQESNNVISIKKASGQEGDYRMKIPATASLSIKEVGWMSDEINVSNHNGEIEVQGTGSDIRLLNISGPVVANTTSGDIEVVFTRLNQEQPSSISNVSGFIDVTLPADTKATLNLATISGEVYTNLDIDTGSQGEMKRLGGSKIDGTLNGGGVEISLRAISDNIYLRKKE